MRIMHLSDLHLGKVILEHSMIEDQEYIINEILDLVVRKKVDVVLICGDVYDKNIPNIQAVNLFSFFLSRLNELGVKVLVISGNHDSRERLMFGNEIFMGNDIYIEGIFDGNLRKVVFNDEYGDINFYMLPFVKPIDVRKYFGDEDIVDYDTAVRCVMDNTDINYEERNILMLHQFVTGMGIDVLRSDDEVISLGGIDNVDVAKFTGFDYVAMGHVHRSQKLLSDTIRYGGSPLKYSFSEVNQKKGVVIVDIKEKGNVDVECVELVPLRNMKIIRGTMDELTSDKFVNKDNRDDYICAVITDEDYIVNAIGKLRDVYRNVLKIEYDNRRNDNVDVGEKYDVRNKEPLELFEDFYYLQNNVKLNVDRKKIIEDVIREVLD